MEITEVRMFLKEGSDRKLKAFATITFDNAFVVRDIKIIEGNEGLFVAMPSRKEKVSCPKCGHRNVVRSKFCNQCGGNLESIQRPLTTDKTARQSEHRDVAHPITVKCREYIQKKVLEAYEAEKTGQASVQPSVAPSPPTEGGLEGEIEVDSGELNTGDEINFT